MKKYRVSTSANGGIIIDRADCEGMKMVLRGGSSRTLDTSHLGVNSK